LIPFKKKENLVRVNCNIVYLFVVVLVASGPSSSGSGDFYKGPLYHHVPASFARSSGAGGLEEKTTRRMVCILKHNKCTVFTI